GGNAFCARMGEMLRFLYRLARLDLYQEPWTVRYGLALVFVAQALAANSLPPAGKNLPFVFFFGAVALSARLCGFGPAVLATVFSTLVADFFFLPPYFSLRLTPSSLVQALIFVLVSLIITSAALHISQAQKAAIESRARLEEALKSITEGFITYSWDWTITYVNPTGAHLWGLTAGEMTGRNVWELFPDVVGSTAHEGLQKAMRERRPAHFESYYPRLNRWYRMAAFPGPRGLTAIFQDISQARETAEALLSTERRLQFTQLAARLGSWEWNLKTNDLWWAE